MNRSAVILVNASLALVVVTHVAAAEPAAGSSPGALAERPPYERVLQGEDARRSEALAEKVEAAELTDNYDEAIQACEELLAIRTRLQGADHWETVYQHWRLVALRKLALLPDEQRALGREATAGSVQADALEAAAKYTLALPLRQAHLELVLKYLGDSHPDAAVCLNNVAFNLNAQGQHAEALPIYEKALSTWRRVLGDNHPHTASGFNNVASNLQAQGKYVEAELHYRKALEIRRSVLGEDDPETASSYNNVGFTLSAQTKYAEATPHYQKSLAIYRRMLGEDHPAAAMGYNNLAGNLHAQGHYAEAAPLFQKALDINRIVLREDHPQTAASYNNVAYSLEALGKYALAAPFYQQALGICRRILGEDHPNTAKCYSNVASSLDGQGKYAEAEPIHRKALEIWKRVLGEDHPDTAKGLNNLASNLQSQDRFPEAAALFQQALEVKLRLFGDDHLESAVGYNNAAGSLQDMGRYAEAAPLYQAALTIHRRVLGESHPDTAACYSNVGLNLNAQGQHAAAAARCQQGLDITRRALGEHHPATAACYSHAATPLLAQGKHGEALKVLQAAAISYESARLGVATRGLERAIFGAENSPYRQLAIAEAHEHLAVDAWHALEADLGRGQSDEAARRRDVSFAADENEEREKLEGQLTALAPQILALVTTADPGDLRSGELADLLSQRAIAEERLGMLAATLSRRELADIVQVQAKLPPDGALLAWVDVVDQRGAVQEHWGCVVQASGLPAWERLPGTGPKGGWTDKDTVLAGKLRDALAHDTTSTSGIDVLARELHAQRLAPLTRHLEGVSTLYVVAVNAMAGIPIDLLTNQHPETQFTVSYVPSGTFLAHLPIERPAGMRILAVGDPIYELTDAEEDSVAPPDDLPSGGLLIILAVPGGAADLAKVTAGDVLVKYGGVDMASVEQLGAEIQAHADDEKVEIAIWREGVKDLIFRDIPPGRLGVGLAPEPAREAIVNRRKADLMLLAVRGDWKDLPFTRVEVGQLASLFGDDATVLVNSAASEQSLDLMRERGELSQWRYLHFATHGEANHVQAFESMLVLSQDQLPETPLPRVNLPYINGQLSANEVLEHWQLNAELVTLSACETANGLPGGGDGQLGFAQAFLTAGARAVCLSLWKVDDAATSLLMTRFYQNLLGKRDGLEGPMPKARALAEAKAWLRELTADEALSLTASATKGVVRGDRGKGVELGEVVAAVESPKAPIGAVKPYAHPRYWSAFILIGDPD